MSWKRPVIRPRTSFGEHSATYAGATAEIAPMPTPEMIRPAYISASPPEPLAVVVRTWRNVKR